MNLKVLVLPLERDSVWMYTNEIEFCFSLHLRVVHAARCRVKDTVSAFVCVFAFVVHGQCIQGHWIVRMRRLDRHNYVSSAQWFISLAELYLSFLTDHFSLKICDRIRRVLRVEAVRKIDISHTCVGWFVCLCRFLFRMQNHLSIQPWWWSWH